MEEMECDRLRQKEELDRERHMRMYEKRAPSIVETNVISEYEVSISILNEAI